MERSSEAGHRSPQPLEARRDLKQSLALADRTALLRPRMVGSWGLECSPVDVRLGAPSSQPHMSANSRSGSKAHRHLGTVGQPARQGGASATSAMVISVGLLLAWPSPSRLVAAEASRPHAADAPPAGPTAPPADPPANRPAAPPVAEPSGVQAPAVGGSARLPSSVSVVPDDPASRTDPATLELLSALERASDDLRHFDAVIVYEKFHALTDGAELQYGRVVYDRATPAPGTADAARTRLGVFFDEYVDSTGRSEAVQQRFVFADGWLAEIDPGRRQFIKRQIVPAGERFDPLKLGEGPFPLPIGQRRDEVLARFDASSAPVPTARLLERIDKAAIEEGRVRALRLIPRAGTREAEDFATLDLYYDRETLLPIGVVATSPEGDRKTVRLSKLRRNEPLGDELLQMLNVDTPKDTAGWTIDVRPWKS